MLGLVVDLLVDLKINAAVGLIVNLSVSLEMDVVFDLEVDLTFDSVALCLLVRRMATFSNSNSIAISISLSFLSVFSSLSISLILNHAGSRASPSEKAGDGVEGENVVVAWKLFLKIAGQAARSNAHACEQLLRHSHQ